jgi:hypothetical protein
MSANEKCIDKISRFMVMMENSSLDLRQPTGIFRICDRTAFSARPMECPGNHQIFTFRLLVITYIDALQFWLPGVKQDKSAIARSDE